MESIDNHSLASPMQSFVPAPDGHRIPVLTWRTPDSPRAVLHICHGMAEHSGRYDDLARFFAAQGIACVAHDHRGHGRNLETDAAGHFADSNGWLKVTRDVGVVQAWIREQYPDSGVFLLGHSMGSFIVQSYLIDQQRPPPLAGLILSGSNLDQVLRLRILRPLISVISRMSGPHANSGFLHRMTFGAFARSVPDAKTEFDWLSTDNEQVTRYIQDSSCGFQCTVKLWQDLAEGLSVISRAANLKKIPENLPVFILSGDRDPVGRFGKGPRALAEAYRKTGHKDVQIRLYPGMRHEPFHEKDSIQVFQEMLDWVDRRHDLFA